MLKPPAMLMMIRPVEKPMASIMAMAESEVAIFFRRMYESMKTAKIEVPKAVNMGFMPIRRPMAMPPKAVCDRPSPIMASFLRIRNRPTMPQTIATIMPPMRAFWKK